MNICPSISFNIDLHRPHFDNLAKDSREALSVGLTGLRNYFWSLSNNMEHKPKHHNKIRKKIG